MKTISVSSHVALSLLLAALMVPAAVSAPVQVTDIIGNLSASDFATYIAPRTFRDWGNEPCIAVNPLNPQEIVVSSFGYSSWVGGSDAQLWHSTNGGATWNICLSVPTPISGDTSFVDDQTYVYDSSGTLHCAMLAGYGGYDYVYHGSTTDATSPAAWNWTGGAPITSVTYPDQPWIAAGAGKVAIAYDNFDSTYGYSEERVIISTDNGATFSSTLDKAIGSPGQVNTSIANPGLRITADETGDFFAIFGVRTNNNASGVPLVHYRLNRNTGGTDWDFTGATPDAIGGLAITNGASRQGNNGAYSFGGINYLLGNITSIAVTTNGSQIYVVYGLLDSNNIGRLFLQQFQPSGTNLVAAGNALAFSSASYPAALPSVAVAENSTVAILYDEFDGVNFHVRLAISHDFGASMATNIELNVFATNGMVLGYGTSPSHNRLLGDYQSLIARSNVFYGAFPARGNVSAGGIVTTNYIDPFFFSIPAFTQPLLSQPVASGGTFQFTLNGDANIGYVIQASTNLQDWGPVLTNLAPTSTRLISISATNSAYFYRAMVNQ